MPGGFVRGTSWLCRQAGYSLIDILAVVGLIGVIAATAIPVTGSAVTGHKFNGDSQAVSNLVGLAKMRASAAFTRARVRANLTDNSFLLEQWDKTLNQWVVDGGIMLMSTGVSFGFGSLGSPPPNTQQTIQFSAACRTGIDSASAVINDTACIIFNSRGLPVDANGDLFGGHGLYLTNGSMVAATTVTTTPRIRRWSSPAQTVSWKEQQ